MGICNSKKDEPKKELNEISNNVNDSSTQDMWDFFKKMNQQKQFVQQYNLFQNFCSSNGLNSNDYDSFVKFKFCISNSKMTLSSPQNPINSFSNNNYSVSNIYNDNLNNNIHNNGYNNNYLNNYTTDNGYYISVPRDQIPIIPRNDSPYFISGNEGKMMNIILKSNAGIDVHLALPGNTTINGMFKKYLDRLKLPYSHLGKDLVFLYNGKEMDPFSQLTIFPTLKNNINIIVFDQGGVIGGIK